MKLLSFLNGNVMFVMKCIGFAKLIVSKEVIFPETVRFKFNIMKTKLRLPVMYPLNIASKENGTKIQRVGTRTEDSW
jgi:hypothetical protein